MTIKLKHGTWVLVADGEKALFLKNSGDTVCPTLDVARKVKEENPPTREQGSDRPGRYSDGPTVHRSAVDDTDWHTLAKERFAEEIAGQLYKLAHRGAFDEIILVAPPTVLGQMRKKLHKVVENKEAGEVPKTMTNMPIAQIETLLQQEWAR